MNALDRAVEDPMASRTEVRFDKDGALYKLINAVARQSEDEQKDFEAIRQARADLAKRLGCNVAHAAEGTAATEEPFVQINRVPEQAKPACEFIIKVAFHLLADGIKPDVVLRELARTAVHFGAPLIACDFIITMANRANGITPEHFIAALATTAIHFDVPEDHFPRLMVQRRTK